MPAAAGWGWGGWRGKAVRFDSLPFCATSLFLQHEHLLLLRKVNHICVF